MKLEEAFKGCKTKRGMLWSFDGVNKEASQQVKPFDWDKHYSGEQVQGLSPVDLETGEVLFLGCDVDLKKKPEEICKNIWSKIGTEYFCYRTMGGKWRIVGHLDDWLGAKEAQDTAKELEKRIEKIGYKCDTDKTLPQSYNLEEGKPGAWWFMPYHPKTPGDRPCDTHCYSPGGLRLTKSQTEFRIKYKKHPIVVSTIGMIGKGEGGSRRKAIFCVLLYKKYFKCDVSFEELNKNFQTPLDEKQLEKDIQHSKESIEKNKYKKEYYLNGEPGWIEKICGAKPYLGAKGLGVITSTLSDAYIYVRSRKEFFELDGSTEFIDKEQINDWWLHITKKEEMMARTLLKQDGFRKVKKYLTHAGKPPGIIEIGPGEIKGVDKGTYLNIYKPSGVIAKKGDVSKINHYYSWALRKDNWHTIKQCLAFMLKEGGEKIQWFIIIHSQVQGVGKGLLALILQSLFGNRNVRINVKFKQMIGTHSTLIDGAQIICLNEVSFNPQNTGERKEFSEEFKNLITEPNLIINPKNKPEIEVPNLVNFLVLSNSKKPLYLGEDDRRAFVVNIKKTKEEIKHKLEKEGYKAEILKVIADPSAFKWHLENEIEYDREMFFQDAPMTEDKEEMIKRNRTEFQKLWDNAFHDKTFPFGNTTLRDGTQSGFHYIYKGLLHTDSLIPYLKMSSKFKLSQTVFYKLDDVEDAIKSKCTPWPNGETTKQAITTLGKRRVYCMEPKWTVKGKTLFEMTEGELGKLWSLDANADDIMKCVEDLPNYEEPTFEEHRTGCWNCKAKIELTEITKCSKCDYAIKCPYCGKCACDKPGSKIKKKHHY